MNLSDEKKKMLAQAVLNAVVTLIVAVAAVFGLNVVAPQPQGGELGALGVGIQPPQTFRSLKIVNSDGLSIGGVTYATPTPIPTPTGAVFYGATPASAKQYCNQTTITGTGTISFPGITTPRAVTYALAQDATGDGLIISHINTTATVTIKVWNSAATPAAATTPVSVDYCVSGQ